jgi:hypothetical protein
VGVVKGQIFLDLDYAASGSANLQGMALIRDDATGGLTFKMAQSVGCSGLITAKDIVIPRKAWTQIVITRENARIVISIDGQAVVTQDCAAAAVTYASASNDDQVWVGKLSGASGASAFPFRGSVDDIMFFDRALGADEIAQLFATGVVSSGVPVDPLFANLQGDDYHLRSAGGRYAMESKTWILDDSTSPCLDAGDPAADYRAEPSPNGGRVNMGAYGGTDSASKSPQW